MPKYFFNVRHENFEPDVIGEHCLNNEAAWKEATQVAGELFKDVDGRFRPGQEWSLEVMDEERKPIYSILVIGKEL